LEGEVDMDEIIKATKEVGFPIVAFLLMFYLNFKTIGKNTDAIKELTKFLRNGK
jgi:hypothetical protein